MKTKLLLAIAITLSFQTFAQIQLGNNLPGEDMSNRSGTSLAFNNTGNFIVVGAPYAISSINGGSSIRGGHVRTYAFNGSGWTTGADFDAENLGDNFGFSVAVSGDGSIIACGAPNGSPNGSSSGYVHVFIAQGTNPIMPNTYIRLGEDLDGLAAAERFGQSIDINDAGTRLVIGAPGGNYVKIYKKDTFADPWTQLGQTIFGIANGDGFGHSVGMNFTGDKIIVGAPSNNGNASNAGHARVYEFDGANWVQLGADFNGDFGDAAGSSVDISDTGNRVAIAFPGVSFGGNSSIGAVKLFDWNGTSWQQIGQDITGDASGEALGGSGNLQEEGAIDLHGGGTRIVVGSKVNNQQGTATRKGYIKMYELDNNQWVKKGVNISGGVDDEFGTAVAINDGDGTIIAGGAPFADDNGSSSGHVRIFDMNSVLSTGNDRLLSSRVVVFPNPTTDIINIIGIQIKSVSVYNLKGQNILNSSKESISLKGIAKGMYLMKITDTENRTTHKKIIIR